MYLGSLKHAEADVGRDDSHSKRVGEFQSGKEQPIHSHLPVFT